MHMNTDPEVIMAQLADRVPLSPHGNMPCPFCGSVELSLITLREKPDHQFIQCEQCLANGPSCDGRETAAIHWNKRAHGREIFIRLEDAEKLKPSAFRVAIIEECARAVETQVPGTRYQWMAKSAFGGLVKEIAGRIRGRLALTREAEQ